MSTAWTRIARMLGITIPTSIAVMAMGSGAAWAQFTQNNPQPGSGPFRLDGSDTLNDVIKAAISKSGANITYHNVGSGQAEKNMANLSGISVQQGIGPMSRNFTSAVLGNHQRFAPGGPAFSNGDNVVCLDAGVVAFGNIPGHAVNLPCHPISGSAVCQQTCDVHTNPLLIALGGYSNACKNSNDATTPSTATTDECASPQRIAAVSLLTTLQGASRIEHIYRRDDASGTQDTFREKFMFNRWCNGKSPGNLDQPGSNLQNYDLDPIRRVCPNDRSDANHSPTRCTFYPLNYPPVGSTCYNGDTLAANDPNNTEGVAISCTQGLVVAMSEVDPADSDITVSMGLRVSSDYGTCHGCNMGLAGLAVLNPNSVAVSLNTIQSDEDDVRGGYYALSRRLFLMKNPDALSTGYVSQAEYNEEEKLHAWLTNRANQCPLCHDKGFYPPTPNCQPGCNPLWSVPCGTADPGLGTPKMNIGAETQACDTAYPCVNNGKIAGTDGTCGGTGTYCPAIPQEASTFACNLNSKCTSGTCLSSGLCQ